MVRGEIWIEGYLKDFRIPAFLLTLEIFVHINNVAKDIFFQNNKNNTISLYYFKYLCKRGLYADNQDFEIIVQVINIYGCLWGCPWGTFHIVCHEGISRVQGQFCMICKPELGIANCCFLHVGPH